MTLSIAGGNNETPVRTPLDGMVGRLGGYVPKGEIVTGSVVRQTGGVAGGVAVNAAASQAGKARFLRGAHETACKLFGTVLGPEANNGLMDEAGQPYAEREAVVLARYGNDEELIHTVATDGEGWLVLQRHLPATMVDLEIHLMDQQEGNPNLTMANYGALPDHYRLEIRRHTLRHATSAGTPHATVTAVTLIANDENNTGDIVLEMEPVVEAQ